MVKLRLGFKAFDPHELLCHFIAREGGLYKKAGLEVELIDITFIPDEDLPPSIFQVSCGSALLSALKGSGQKVVFVSTDRPMFWLYSTQDIRSMSDLKDMKIATYPPIAPPCHFMNIILRQDGVGDTACVPARDDTARLGLLRSGHASAAVVSSAIPKQRVERLGYHTLCFFGNRIRVPATGLAVHHSRLEKDPESVGAICTVLAQSLALLRNDSLLVKNILGKYFDVSMEEQEDVTVMAQECFTENGRTGDEIARSAIALMCETLGIPDKPDPEQVYDFSFLGN